MLRRRVAWLLLLILGAGTGLCWGHRRVLTLAGDLLVADDAAAPADLIVVSGAAPFASAVEIVRLAREGVRGRVVVPRWPQEQIDDERRRLDVAYVEPEQRVRDILERGGIPAADVVMLAEVVDGTGPESTAVAAFVRAQGAHSVLVVTARNHGARMRWLLRRALPADVDVRVRSPRTDGFAPTAWWSSRDQSRQVMTEYLRWVNDLVLGDPWARRAPRER